MCRPSFKTKFGVYEDEDTPVVVKKSLAVKKKNDRYIFKNERNCVPCCIGHTEGSYSLSPNLLKKLRQISNIDYQFFYHCEKVYHYNCLNTLLRVQKLRLCTVHSRKNKGERKEDLLKN